MIELFLILVLAALVMEIVDSSLGMFYGTLLAPLLIGLGYDPLLVVPSILISQALGNIPATVFHHRLKNANFKGMTRDTKVTLMMVVPGLGAVVIGALVAVSLPVIAVKTYIGILVIAMSLLCLSKLKYKFKWWKHSLYGTLAAFNKVLTGGGFGPLTSTGGIIGGLEPRASIATTEYAEIIICFAAFASYMILRPLTNPLFATALCIGAIIGGIIGPYICSKINQAKLRKIVAILGIIAGAWVLVKIVI